MGRMDFVGGGNGERIGEWRDGELSAPPESTLEEAVTVTANTDQLGGLPTVQEKPKLIGNYLSLEAMQVISDAVGWRR